VRSLGTSRAASLITRGDRIVPEQIAASERKGSARPELGKIALVTQKQTEYKLRPNLRNFSGTIEKRPFVGVAGVADPAAETSADGSTVEDSGQG
jgi:hypothetical protein